jgi:hypothetical protein
MGIFVYLIWTIGIEGAVLLILMRGWRTHAQAVMLLASACSWSVLQVLWRDYDVNIWLMECSVTLFEGIILSLVAQIPYQKAFLFSFLTNAASLGIGILIHGLPE